MLDRNSRTQKTPGKFRAWFLAALLLVAALCGAFVYRLRVLAAFAQPITLAFHVLYYYSGQRTWQNTYWLGMPVLKSAPDLWVLQEIIFFTRPDVIIETGTFLGGSALFMASICESMNHGRVITIDIADFPGKPRHPRITYLLGSSTSPEIAAQVKNLIQPQEKVMVVLDSDHSKDHVLRELNIYGKLASKDTFLIVEDTHVNGRPVDFWHGPGPGEAVQEFLRNNNDFVVDRGPEKLFLTFNPRGYLRRVR